eukprot:CAMPEP_0168743652 /NCGR_PEP_ID=MMETSP0724-20121128/13687_1 /TAXON_ID=265536 /ORGANISM="Amphiprora sp., Strain CCMP467" /LENGTH=201 /DNA_ID=CAMNT_0008791289 /DNA_START=16 /DNA_END=621 /DNA_ORIENTATION=-
MKSAIFASLVAAASAFAPASQKAASSSTALNAFEDDIGTIGPVGFFDPLGLVADGNQEKFDRLRFVELKHGRISMLAVVGYLTNAGGKYLNGAIDFSGKQFSDCGYGIDALTKISPVGLAQVFGFIGFLELFVMKDITGGEFVGDFRNGYIDFGWDSFDEETKIQKRAVELNQGRAAMMGILGLMLVHEELGNVSDLFFRP